MTPESIPHEEVRNQQIQDMGIYIKQALAKNLNLSAPMFPKDPLFWELVNQERQMLKSGISRCERKGLLVFAGYGYMKEERKGGL